jgi:hypothetical protein
MIERLWRTVKYDDIYVRGYETMSERYQGLPASLPSYPSTPKAPPLFGVMISGMKIAVGWSTPPLVQFNSHPPPSLMRSTSPPTSRVTFSHK